MQTGILVSDLLAVTVHHFDTLLNSLEAAAG
jgi:hypothetical protein